MVVGGSDSFAEAHVSNEAKVAIRYAKSAPLRLQEHLQHGDHVPRHFAAMVSTAPPCFIQLAGIRIGSFGDAQDSGANMRGRPFDDEVGSN